MPAEGEMVGVEAAGGPTSKLSVAQQARKMELEGLLEAFKAPDGALAKHRLKKMELWANIGQKKVELEEAEKELEDYEFRFAVVQLQQDNDVAEMKLLKKLEKD